MSAPIHNIRDGVIPAIAPAQVTEAHLRLASLILLPPVTVESAAQRIADSEAAAVEPYHAMAAKTAMRVKSLTAERDQLRAEVEKYKALYLEEETMRRNANKANDQLRVEASTEKTARKEMDRTVSIWAERAETAEREVERLTKAAVPLCIGAPIIGILAHEGQYLSKDGQALIAASDLFGNDPYARAERAEAILGKLQELHGCSQEMVVYWSEHAAKRSYKLVKAQAELAKERARLKAMAAELAHCAGYIASVRTDRQITWHEALYALQTLEWAEGAVEIAENANAVLEAHDAAMKEDKL